MWIALLLAAVVIVAAAHWPVLAARALCFDDHDFLTDNPLVRNPGWHSAERFFGEVLAPSTVPGYYIPLTMVSLMLDARRGATPENLRPIHETSLVLHILTTLLLIVSLTQLCGRRLPALVAGLLFALHPLTVEPVAWIAERKTLLAAFFAMATLVLYVRAARRGGWLAHAGAWLTYLLALLSKPTVLPLPFILILLDVWPLNRLNRRSLIEKAPFILLAAVSAVITLLSHQRAADIGIFEDYTPLQGLLLAFYKPAFYLSKMFFPAGLSPSYAPPQPFTLAHPAVLASIAVLTLLAAGALALRRRTKAGWVTLAIFLAGLAPTLGFVQYSWVILSDKYLYILPLLGPLLLLVCGLQRAFQTGGTDRGGALRLIAGIACLLALGGSFAATRAQIAAWRDTVTLYRHMIDHTPRTALLYSNLGLAYEKLGLPGEALRAFEQAVRLKPQRAEFRGNLASALARAGRLEEAIAEYERALPDNPEAASIHASIADALITLGRFDEAFAHLEQAVHLDPHLAMAHNNRGRALAFLGRIAEARESFEAAVASDPLQYAALANIGGLLAQQGRYGEAVEYFRRALAIQPSFVEGHSNLAVSLAALGRPAEAEPHFKEALRLRSDFLPALLGYGEFLAARDRPAEAARAFNAALRIQPGNPRALAGLQAGRAGGGAP
ncbi:MAG: tetratricopeptide repeat protein [Candidatus Eisenbacteria bacterium]